jgi:hypothetical protein
MKGETLFNATQIVHRAGDEIDAMCEKLFALFEEALESHRDISRVEDLDEERDENEWILVGYLAQYAIYRRRGRRPSAYLAVQIKLADDREGSLVGKKPLLYVLFSGKKEWEYDKFLLANAVKDGWKLHGSKLWEWYTDQENLADRPWYDAQWAFVLPLVSMNTEDDLRKEIVSPVIALIDGKSPEKAFAEAKKVLSFVQNGEEVCLETTVEVRD